ncbi:uncharacterized protein LOC121731364 [Aricia agestis]|uniref:uncharacterized protein LOC121731364 n=1 Tax=Aricia agestis TaxID=91739 RepID=UPI001C201686|nr:uncharacterized protein LOC121731364 [Aricia agestis]
MDAADKRMLDREALRNMIQQWNANRLDLFELSEPNENLEFHGVMRFYFQDSGQKIATKCIRVASDATVSDVIETLIEKFRPDMRMLSLGSYSLWETHGPSDERRLEPHEKPLLVQLNWHADDREGRFLLKCLPDNQVPVSTINEKSDQNFKRKLSKREKKELKKKEKLSRLKSDSNNENRPVAEKLYTELPETSFTRSISNPEAVMRRRRQQKLERKLQQFRSKDGGPDTGGTLKIYGSSLCPDVPYKTLLLSVGDCAAGVLREMLDKYGLSRHDPAQYCIVQVDTADNSEYILEDDECPLAIVMTHPHRSSIMFHVRRRPSDAQPRRRKKKSGGAAGGRPGSEPALLEVTPDGAPLENGRRVRVTDIVEVGSGNGTALQLYGPSIQPRHCVVAAAEGGGYTVTPLHADAHVYVNGRRVVHTQRLQHGCLLKFGRVSTFRFVDPAQETIMNRNLAQSQNFGSGSLYDRSAEDGAMSPTSHQDEEYPTAGSPLSHDTYTPDPYNNNTLKLDNESLLSPNDTNEDDNKRSFKDNYETTFDIDGNVETKSTCSTRSGGSGNDNRGNIVGGGRGTEAVLPAVLEFPEAGQAQFLAAVISHLDPHAPAFKLAPVYTLYLCARYRASTHYRPELTPTERAHKLTAFLHHVATLIHATVQERSNDSAAQAFWLANASELLHFLKCDRHISSFSTQAQELLPVTVQNAFSNLVSCFQEELSGALAELTEAGAGGGAGAADATEATAPTLQALAAAMVLLRCCRVNSALTIQLFFHLFHYINAVCFNKLVNAGAALGGGGARWGAALSARLALLAAWAERQGLELAAECHLARTIQAARLIQGTYRTAEEACAAVSSCFKLNSVQVRALLSPLLPPDILEPAVAHARANADELSRADGREIALEESGWLGAGLLVPDNGFSAEVVRGVPPGLAEFVAPLQRGGLCRLTRAPHARGLWSVYLRGYGPAPRAPAPRLHLVQLHKNANGMGLSIVAAKGANQSKLGIYIKSVVPGGAAAADGRLAAGDQLLSVDGHSLVGITQEKAAEYLVRTGPIVTLEVAKQGAVLHGLATLLHQPAYNQRQDEELTVSDPLDRNSGLWTNPHPALLRPTSPLTELATAGNSSPIPHLICAIFILLSFVSPFYFIKSFLISVDLFHHVFAFVVFPPVIIVSCLSRPRITGTRRRHQYSLYHFRDESSESSTDRSEECAPHYFGSIPKLIVTLDQENNQLREDLSPETPGCPAELSGAPARPIPVFTFTCADADEQAGGPDTHVPQAPPIAPEPPASYDHSSDSADTVCLPPQMRPIDPKLTLDFFRAKEEAFRRCTGVDDCVSACECCRTPQPEENRIPFIDEPNSEPIIYENDRVHDRVATPKIRRILPSLSLDSTIDRKPETVDAMCQTNSPVDCCDKTFGVRNGSTDVRRDDLVLNLKEITDEARSHPRGTVSNATSASMKSDETEAPSTYSTSDSFDDLCNNRYISKSMPQVPVEICADRKSWKSPDEYRPGFGKVKALTKHFNEINLKYCVRSYRRNCKSSPNLSARRDESFVVKDNLPTSASLADIHYERNETATTDRMSEDEVKSIIIQLEDWSRFGSRGSEDTLAQGNEFELPNLPSEDHTDGNASITSSYIFTEIVDNKPKTITLDNIKLKSNPTVSDKDSPETSKSNESMKARVVALIPKQTSSEDVSLTSESLAVRSCPDVRNARDRPLHSRLFTQLRQPRGVAGAGRRASERDLPSRLAAEPVKPSKSTPALHALSPVSPPPLAMQSPTPHTQTLQPNGNLSTGSVSWANKSRSSHNLSAQNDSFYQNLSSVQAHQHHTLNDSSSGSTRPQSAHFNAAEPSPDPSASHVQANQQANAANARAAKLAEMSEEVTRRQQHQQQMQQQQLHQQQLQHQQMQQQHMQQQHMQQQHQQQQHQQQQLQHYQQLQQQQFHNQQQMQKSQLPHQHLGSQQHLSQSQPLVYSSQQNFHTNMQHVHAGQPHLNTNQPHLNAGQPHLNTSQPHGNAGQPHANTSQHMHVGQPHMHASQTLYSPQQSSPLPQGMHLNLHHTQYAPAPHSPSQMSQQNTPQRYEWHQPGPPSPQRSQPPVAPKPNQNTRRSEIEDDQYHQQQQQQSTLQPDEEHYVASACGPPAVSVYPVGGVGGGAPHNPAHNPWQREERERQVEARRAAARARRDAAIAALVSLGAARSPVQNQQLRALQLERDFERRATMDQDETGNGEGDAENRSSSPEPELEREPEREPERERHSQPPKSILKTNTRTELTNGYTHTSVVEERVCEVTSGVAGVSLGGGGAAPPPPERGSSFAVMATRLHEAPPPSAVVPPPQSPVSVGRDKRVSFHERALTPPPPASSPPPLDTPAPAPAPATTSAAPAAPHDGHATPQNPERFIEEAESMLSGASPTTPPAALTHTPGVIGAQEVYRDPRTRRLLEQQARAPAAPVPEQLSFKEKMKMFALESGEAATPKDKVKISRAQRDIDAVH